MEIRELINTIVENVSEQYNSVTTVSDSKLNELNASIDALELFINKWDAENVDVDFNKDDMSLTITMQTYYIEESVDESAFINDVLMKATAVRIEGDEEGRTRIVVTLPGVWESKLS